MPAAYVSLEIDIKTFHNFAIPHSSYQILFRWLSGQQARPTINSKTLKQPLQEILWGSNDTNSPLNCSCVPISPRFLLTSVPPCVSVRGDLLLLLSQTNLSGHNRLPLQLCCFWNGNPSAPLVLPLGRQKLAKKTLFDGFISPPWAQLTVDFCASALGVGPLFTFTHHWGSCVIMVTQLGISSRCEVIPLDYHLQSWKSMSKKKSIVT